MAHFNSVEELRKQANCFQFSMSNEYFSLFNGDSQLHLPFFVLALPFKSLLTTLLLSFLPSLLSPPKLFLPPPFTVHLLFFYPAPVKDSQNSRGYCLNPGHNMQRCKEFVKIIYMIYNAQQDFKDFLTHLRVIIFQICIHQK